MATRVLLADDHTIVRQGLRILLQREGFEVVGEAANGAEAVRLATETTPDVVVLDYGMPLMNGLTAAREIMVVCPRAKLILLTMHADDRYVLEAVRLGVKGYVVKSQAPTDLVRAIHEVLNGMMYLSPRVSRTVVQAYRLGAVGRLAHHLEAFTLQQHTQTLPHDRMVVRQQHSCGHTS